MCHVVCTGEEQLDFDSVCGFECGMNELHAFRPEVEQLVDEEGDVGVVVIGLLISGHESSQQQVLAAMAQVLREVEYHTGEWGEGDGNLLPRLEGVDVEGENDVVLVLAEVRLLGGVTTAPTVNMVIPGYALPDVARGAGLRRGGVIGDVGEFQERAEDRILQHRA
jgi:hypothetical protein